MIVCFYIAFIDDGHLAFSNFGHVECNFECYGSATTVLLIASVLYVAAAALPRVLFEVA